MRLRSILGITTLKNYLDTRFSDEVVSKVDSYANLLPVQEDFHLETVKPRCNEFDPSSGFKGFEKVHSENGHILREL